MEFYHPIREWLLDYFKEPNAETTLNAADLLSAASAEKQQLIEELRGMLETTTRSKLLEAKREEIENLNATLIGSPLLIYVG